RYREPERAACPRSAQRLDPAAVCFHDSFRDGEPQPRSVWIARPVRPESIEQMRQMIRRYSGSRIGHEEPHLAIERLDANDHLSARRRELESVSQQIRQHLKQPLLIGLHTA